MNEKRLVCQLHPAYLGRSEIFIHRFVNNLAHWQACVLTERIQNAASYKLGDRYPVIEVGSGSQVGFRMWAKVVRTRRPTTGDYLALHARYSKALAAVKPALLHAQFGSTGWFALPLHRLHRLPLVVSFHGYDASALLRQAVWRSRYRELFGEVHAVTVPSRRMAARLAATGCPPEKLHLLRYGVDLHEWSFRPPAVTVEKETVDVLMVSRLVEKKGVLDAIEAVAAARRIDPRLRLQIAGEGEMMPQITECIASRGLQSHVRLLGFVPNAQVRELMRASDLLLTPSRTAADGDEEGLPNVLIEAAAAGLPIIATDHAGAGELIEDGVSGFLVDTGSPHLLAARLIALAENAALRQTFAGAARHKVECEFDLARSVACLEAIYDDACRARTVAHRRMCSMSVCEKGDRNG